MKKTLAFLLGAMLMGTVALAEPDWSQYPMGNLQVSFPVEPARSSQVTSSPLGPVNVTVYELQQSGYRLTGSASTLPPLALQILDARSLYRMAAQELLEERPGARGANLRYLTLLGRPAAELTYSLPDGQAGQARMLLSNQSMTTLEATWNGSAAPPEVGRFLDSLAAR